jgi:subtilase family serine protease
LRSAYNITGVGNPSTTIAIVDAFGYPTAEADLAVYRSRFGLPACTTANGCFRKVNQRGIQGLYPAYDIGWAEETALDLDMVSAMCPACKIILVEATTNSFRDLAAAENTAAALGAHVISNSYGGGEAYSQSVEPSYYHPGIAITASTGDDGYGVQFPASSPHVTAVGGTSLYRGNSVPERTIGVRPAVNTRGWTETAWSGAGSGCSKIYGKPVWQSDPLCSMRMEADVSAVADPYTGVLVYAPYSQAVGGVQNRTNPNASSSTWLIFGGTSVSAPLVAGIYGVNGGSVTYGKNPYNNLNALNDVTSGNNGSCGGTYFCTALPGYDGPTGLGTPNGPSAFGGNAVNPTLVR